MRETLLQTRALAQLVLRYWARAGVPNPVRNDQSRRASGAILRLAFVMLFVNWGYRAGSACATKAGVERESAIVWLVVGLFGVAAVGSAHGRLPGVRTVQPPTSSPILDPLPLRAASMSIMALLERVTLYALSVAALVAAVPHARARGALVALLVTTTALLTGDALLRGARISISPMRLARLGVGIVFFQLPFLVIVATAPALASTRLAKAVAILRPAGRAIADGEGLVYVALVLVAMCVLAGFGVRAAERIGYDRVDVVPDRRLGRARTSSLTIEGVEGILAGREPGGRFGLPLMLLYTIVASGGALYASWTLVGEENEARVHVLMRVAIFVATFGAFVLVNSRATRMIGRDAVARPFLAPLPITPADMLLGKARALRRRALLVASPSLLLLLAPASRDLRIEIAIRLAAVLAAVALAAGATVSVAFLTQGLGATRTAFGSFNLETMLVAMPLFAVAAPPYRWFGIVGVAALALLAFEARRAALACVRWMDDGDDFARETPVWRALLVFAAFFAAQSLTLRAFAFTPMNEATKTAVAYGVGVLALVALTLQSKRGLADITVLPRARTLGPAVAVGAACGGVALLYGSVLRGMDVELPTWSFGTPSRPLLFALLVVVPIAEEVFFRGWLQSAIALELDPRWQWVAPFLGAFALAIINPFTFAPLFVFASAVGFLYQRTRSLGAAIVAHAVFDAFAVFAF